MKLDDLTKADVGRRVIYRPRHGVDEVGTLTSWNDRWLFVRFRLGKPALACDPSHVEFDDDAG